MKRFNFSVIPDVYFGSNQRERERHLSILTTTCPTQKGIPLNLYLKYTSLIGRGELALILANISPVIYLSESLSIHHHLTKFVSAIDPWLLLALLFSLAVVKFPQRIGSSQFRLSKLADASHVQYILEFSEIHANPQ